MATLLSACKAGSVPGMKLAASPPATRLSPQGKGRASSADTLSAEKAAEKDRLVCREIMLAQS
jgi:hypothetical protein